MVWELYQYPALTGPASDPTDFIEPTFFEAWNQPINQPVLPVEYRYQIQNLFFSGVDPNDFVEPTFFPSWVQPINEAVLPIEYRYNIPSIFSQIEPDDFIEPTFFPSWMQQINEPVLPIEYRYQIPNLFVQIDPDDFVEPTFFPAWGPPISEPVLPIEFRYTIPNVFFQGEPDDFVVVAVPDFGWFRPLEEPVRPIEFRHNLQWIFSQIDPDDFVEPTFFPSWGPPIQQPVLPIEYRYQIQNFFSQINTEDLDTAKKVLRYLSLDIGGGLSLSITPSGDLFQIVPITTTPLGQPQADKGVMFQLSGGTAKIQVWNTATNLWVTLALDIGATVGSGTSGSILFVDSSGNLSQDNSQLFWDDTNNRIGIRTTTPLSAIDVLGSFGYKIQTVTADTTLDDTFGSVLVDATAGNVTVTLPTATSSTRRLYDVKKIDSTANTVTVDGNGTEKIDGALIQVITLQYDSMSLRSDGTEWFIV